MSDRAGVAVLSPSLAGHGGIQRVTRLLVDALESSPYVSAVRLCELKTSGERVSAIEGLNFTANIIRTLNALRPPRMQVAVHVGLLPPAVVCGKLSGTRTVAIAHGTEAWGTVPKRHRVFTPLVDRVWAVSEFTRCRVSEAWGVAPDRIDVVNPCLPAGAEELADTASRLGTTLLTVARLDAGYEYKGIDTVLRALVDIRREVPAVRYLVVGSGTGRPSLEALASELGVASNVEFLGSVSDADLRRVYSQSDVFVMPSRGRFEGSNPQGEGFGIVYVEAAAAGLPVVGSTAGGAAEAVVDGVTGFVVDPDDVSDIANACTTLLSDTSLRAEMGYAARLWALEHFSFKRFKSDVDGLIPRVMRWAAAAPHR